MRRARSIGGLLRTLGQAPASASDPSAPTLDDGTVGDGQVVLDFTADDEAHTIYARYLASTDSTWADESESFKRTGTGAITVTGLTNGTPYSFIGYAKSGGFYSQASNIRHFTPDDGSNDPTGVMGLALDHLRTLVASSATFQAWTGSANTEEAKSHVYVQEIDPDDVLDARPFALVALGPESESDYIAMGASQQYQDSGTMYMFIEADTDSSYSSDNAEAANWFLRKIDGVIDDMKALAGKTVLGTDHLVVSHMGLDSGPGRSHRSTWAAERDHFFVAYRIDWGISG